jgi:arsenite oxidase small subunit
MFGFADIEPFARTHFARIDRGFPVRTGWHGPCSVPDETTRTEDRPMKRCDLLVDVGRRRFLSGAGVAAAGAAASTVLPASPAGAQTPAARVAYPTIRLGNIRDLKLNEPMEVSYPDGDAPGVLLKLGKRVEGGVGPDGDVVGFTTICPHKGYPLHYSRERRTLNCSGHYSVFDCEAGGQETWGHATQNLPQYTLRVDDGGDIFAEGLDELIYGRLSNVLRPTAL